MNIKMLQLTMFNMLLFGTCLLCGVLYGQEADGQEVNNCSTPVYLEIGKEGKVPCSYQDYTIISWYTKDIHDANGASLVNFDNNDKRGSGYLSGKFDILSDGSLIIRNTSLGNDGFYAVTVAQDDQGKEWTQVIEVIVTVPPDPDYPLVDNIHKRHVFMEVERNGTITCSMIRVRPVVSLTWTVIDSEKRDKISFYTIRASSTRNDDDTFDVSLTSGYYVEDDYIKRLTIQCGVDGIVGNTLTVKTTVDLLFISEYPVVNGYLDQQHIFLDVEREGSLTCWKKNVDVSTTTLDWDVVEPSMRDKITFKPIKNKNNTVNINTTLHYVVEDNSLDRITIACKVFELNKDFVTTVDLLFPAVYPVVNGHTNQKHVYLDVEREGHLTCMKENVEVGTILVWELLDPSMRDKITFQNNSVISIDNDGTITINGTFDYEVNDNSLERITVECKVMEPETDPLATKVDLLFQNVYPVVNGRINQKHVYLDVEREGHLTCLKENVESGTRLDWELLDPSMRDKITFQSNAVISNNNDGTVNINQTCHYIVQDVTLEKIAIKCSVIDPDADKLPYVTRVELLLGDALVPFTVAVIDGCYSQQDHCALEVERTGKLTCTVKNIHYPVDLQWSVLDGDPTSLVFKDGSPSVQNNTSLFDISLTAPYTVFKDSLKHVIVQCDARRSDSGLLISKARASLVIQNAGDSSHGTVVVLSCAIIFLVIALGLIVSIMWYCNRKMYKKSEMKYLELLDCRNNGNGYHISEVTGDQITSYTTVAGSPVRRYFELHATNAPQGAKRDKSSDSPDSGNSGSNSRERSGSEASEKSGLMGDTKTSCRFDKQGSLDDKRGFPEGDPMV